MQISTQGTQHAGLHGTLTGPSPTKIDITIPAQLAYEYVKQQHAQVSKRSHIVDKKLLRMFRTRTHTSTQISLHLSQSVECKNIPVSLF